MTMPLQNFDVAAFLTACAGRTLFDVRSPAEYAKGHIPGAVNLPLFSDEERAEVGTLYTQVGKEQALRRGLELVGGRLTSYLDEVRRVAGTGPIAVHCWRGGQRSGSMAQLFAFAGYDVIVLRGGYKAYRRHVLEHFASQRYRLVVLGGKTGSGKTEILARLAAMGEQVLDLEALAHHKGSAFGALGQRMQPTVEQFENELFTSLRLLDPSRRIWVENESQSIGRVFIPADFWRQMRQSPLIHVELPLEERLRRVISEYGHFPKEDLLNCLRKITKRMGPQHEKAAEAAYLEGDIHTATRLVLDYYDKTYAHATSKGNFCQVWQLTFDVADCQHMADQLKKFADERDL